MILLFPCKAFEADEKGKPLVIIFPEGTPDHRQHMEMTGKIKPCHNISANLSWKCLGIALKTTFKTNGALLGWQNWNPFPSLH